MKTYELVISRSQPTCGGKSPWANELLSVQTDDPAAYVRGREPGASLEVDTTKPGTTVVSFLNGRQQVRYEFTEE